MLPFLLACFAPIAYEPAAGDTGDPSGSGTSVTPFDVTGVEPADGPTGGGMDVTVRGGPFTAGSIRVWFGDAEAEVQSVSTDALVVALPPVDEPGSVDVTVRIGDREATRRDAFRYWEDAGGGSTVLASWLYLRSADSSAWDESHALQVWAWTLLVEPVDMRASDVLAPAALDTCTLSAGAPGNLHGPDVITMDAPGGPYGLSWSEGGYEYYGYVDWYYPGGGAVGLHVPESDFSPDLELTQVVQVPHEFPTLSAPSGFHSSRGGEADLSDLTFEWDPGSLDAGFVVIWLVDAASQASPTVYCRAENDGSFTVPGAYLSGFSWTDYYLWREAYVYAWVIGVDEESEPLAYSNGAASVQAGIGVYGYLVVYD